MVTRYHLPVTFYPSQFRQIITDNSFTAPATNCRWVMVGVSNAHSTYLLYIYLSTCILCTLRTANAQSEVFFSFLLSASLQFFHFHYHFNYMSRGGGSLTYRLNYHRWPLLNILWYLFLWLPSVIKSSLPHFEHTFHQNGCARTHLISFYNLIHYHGSYQLILLSSNLEYHLILN